MKRTLWMLVAVCMLMPGWAVKAQAADQVVSEVGSHHCSERHAGQEGAEVCRACCGQD